MSGEGGRPPRGLPTKALDRQGNEGGREASERTSPKELRPPYEWGRVAGFREDFYQMTEAAR